MMTTNRSIFVSVGFSVVLLFSSTADAFKVSTEQIPNLVQPTQGEDWLRHLRDDLLPFWDKEEAYGSPVGNFPTFRCNDGSVLDLDNPCPVFAELGPDDRWITDNFDKDYIRMKSRQIYSYGVAYHLTGETRFLVLAKSGVDYLQQHALDPRGTVASYFQGSLRHLAPAEPQRTSQDLAYALQGLGFYYYLTRDVEILPDILRIKDYIIGNYYDGNWDLMRWVNKSPLGLPQEANRKELVALLDQVNAYMLLLAPILPEPFSSEWEKDLVAMCRIMIERFYSPEKNLFWGAITTKADRQIGGNHHTDFGHSIKTFWMIYMVGKLSQELDLVNFARENGSRLLKRAFHEESGSWASRPNADGSLNLNKEWWIYAELDQTAATFSLEDPAYKDKYLTKTYRWWMENMVDHENQGVWHWVSFPSMETRFPKVHLWKNGYHSFEHTLIGYITDQSYQGQPAKLFFALDDASNPVLRPYYYTARDISSSYGPVIEGLEPLKQVAVEFEGISSEKK